MRPEGWRWVLLLWRDPDRPGRWLWNLDGIEQRPLYRLPGLLAADPAEPVFVTEGEKDADHLRSLGLVATTNSGGSSAWSKTATVH